MRLVGGSVVAEPGDSPSGQTSSEDTRTDDDIYPRCETCGELNYEFVPGTRGRKPRYHADCKPVSPTRTGTRTRGGLRNEAALRDALTSRYMQLGNVASIFHPAYGVSIKQRIGEAVEADIELARVNPKFRGILESALEKTALGAVIAVHVAMLQPVGVRIMANRQTRTAKSPASGRAPSGHGDTAPATPPGRPSRPSPDTPSNVVNLPRDDGMPEPPTSAIDEPSNAANLDGMPG